MKLVKVVKVARGRGLHYFNCGENENWTPKHKKVGKYGKSLFLGTKKKKVKSTLRKKLATLLRS